MSFWIFILVIALAVLVLKIVDTGVSSDGLAIAAIFTFFVVPILFVSGVIILSVLYLSWLILFHLDKVEKLIAFIQGL